MKLLDLLDELKDVNDWFYFGLYLKVPLSLLKEIRSNYRTVIDQKIDMLDQWSELVVPTWGRVVQALVGIGRMRLATHIGSKHGELCLSCKVPVFSQKWSKVGAGL